MSSPRAAQLTSAIDQEMPGVRADLERLVRIPSVSFPGHDHTQIRRSAELTAELFAGCGLTSRIVEAGGQPAVLGHRPGPAGAPSVLLYAHHDVQPAGDRDLWDSEPFEATERGGRLYGRGAADDKAGIMVHVAALRALNRVLGNELPLGVTVFIEGEEEHGTGATLRLIEQHQADLASDVIVVADAGNWDVGVPSLTTTLRGGAYCVVEVRTLNHGVHSGVFGGVVPDALTVLCRLVATLHDSAGDVAVEGLRRSSGPPLEYPPERLRVEAGLVPGAGFVGTGPLVDRLWAKPALAILGMDAPSVAQAAGTIIPAARAVVGLRTAPGEDPHEAFEAMRRHFEKQECWGAQLSVTLVGAATGCVIDSTGPLYDVARAAIREAWDGVEPVEIGSGGSIPLVTELKRRFPAATILVTGVEDPDTRAHSPNESLHLGEFRRACLAEALLLARLGAPWPGQAATA